MRRFRPLAATALALVLGLSVSAAGAQPAGSAGPDPALGVPPLAPLAPYGYYVWHTGNRVHLRTTDPGDDASIYTGTITTDGTIYDVDMVRDEADDWAVAGRHHLEFHFRTWNAVDGVSFDVAGATQVTFRLYRNGHLISTEHIFLGAERRHPPGNPFTLVLT
jgi:hypothetical protein